MITTLDSEKEGVLGFQLSGKLHDEDYQHFVPAVETAIDQFGKIRLVVQFHDFQGWDMHALWDDIKFSTKHCSDISRIAMVGDKKWEEWMAKVCKPFTLAKVDYFDNLDSAWQWAGEEE